MLRPTTRNVSPFCAIASWFWTRGGCKIGEYERWSWWQSFSIQTDMESGDRVIGAYLQFPEPRIYPTFRFTSFSNSNWTFLLLYNLKSNGSGKHHLRRLGIMFGLCMNVCCTVERMKAWRWGVWSHNTCELRAKSGRVRGPESSLARLSNLCLLRKF